MSTGADDFRRPPAVGGELIGSQEVTGEPARSLSEEVENPAAVLAPTAILRFDFGPDGANTRFALALASLFSGVAEAILTIDASGRSDDDLDIVDLKRMLQSGRAKTLQFQVRLPRASAQVEVTFDNDDIVTLSMPVLRSGRYAGKLWLQAEMEYLGPLPLLALQVADTGFLPDALHALVAVAARQGELTRATLSINGTSDSCTWWTDNPPPGSRPLEGLQGDSIWIVYDPILVQPFRPGRG